jgi:hypothetical protein
MELDLTQRVPATTTALRHYSLRNDATWFQFGLPVGSIRHFETLAGTRLGLARVGGFGYIVCGRQASEEAKSVCSNGAHVWAATIQQLRSCSELINTGQKLKRVIKQLREQEQWKQQQ